MDSSALKTTRYVRQKVKRTQQLLDNALRNVNRYKLAALDQDSDQQQQQQQSKRSRQQQQQQQAIPGVLIPSYSQNGPGMPRVERGDRAVPKINRLGAKLTEIMDSILLLLRSKDKVLIYSNMSPVLFYLDFILDPFLTSMNITTLNAWMVDVTVITTNPIGKTVESLAKTLQSKYVTASQPVSLAKPFYLMMGQQQGGAGGGGGGEGGGIKITGKPKLSSLLTLGMFTMPQKPSKKRPRTQQQQQKKK